MSTNRHKRITAVHQKASQPLTLGETTRMVNADYGTDYSEGIIARSLWVLHDQCIVCVETKHGELTSTITERGRNTDVTLGRSASGRVQCDLNQEQRAA